MAASLAFQASLRKGAGDYMWKFFCDAYNEAYALYDDDKLEECPQKCHLILEQQAELPRYIRISILILVCLIVKDYADFCEARSEAQRLFDMTKSFHRDGDDEETDVALEELRQALDQLREMELTTEWPDMADVDEDVGGEIEEEDPDGNTPTLAPANPKAVQKFIPVTKKEVLSTKKEDPVPMSPDEDTLAISSPEEKLPLPVRQENKGIASGVGELKSMGSRSAVAPFKQVLLSRGAVPDPSSPGLEKYVPPFKQELPSQGTLQASASPGLKKKQSMAYIIPHRRDKEELHKSEPKKPKEEPTDESK